MAGLDFTLQRREKCSPTVMPIRSLGFGRFLAEREKIRLSITCYELWSPTTSISSHRSSPLVTRSIVLCFVTH